MRHRGTHASPLHEKYIALLEITGSETHHASLGVHLVSYSPGRHLLQVPRASLWSSLYSSMPRLRSIHPRASLVFPAYCASVLTEGRENGVSVEFMNVFIVGTVAEEVSIKLLKYETPVYCRLRLFVSWINFDVDKVKY